ncbi:MAG: hypothetical protein RSD99_24435, partial [Janthinobacterium sp.]
MDTSTKNGAAAIPAVSRGKRLAQAVFGVFLGFSGLALAAGGIELITLGGSWYYLPAGLGLILAGVLYWRRKPLASGVVAALVLATLLWAVWEIGFAFWPMAPRLTPFLVIGLAAALLHPWLAGRRHTGQSRGFAALFAVVLVAGFAAMFKPHGVLEAT